MNTIQHISAAEASEPSLGDEVTEFLPWVATIMVLAPITLLSLMLWAPFLLLFALVAAPFVVAGVLGLGAALLALPFLLIRHLHQAVAERRRSAERSIAIPASIAHTTFGGQQ